MNPRKMKQMMEQMGIDVEEIEASEVIIRTDEGEMVFDQPEVTKMDARGQETYQVLGSPELRESGAGEATEAVADADADADTTADEGASASGIPDADVEIVAQRADVPAETAREALEATDGDLAAAVDRLE